MSGKLSPSERLIAAYAELKPKRNKYGARKTVLDGIRFDSKAEAAYYANLKIREREGEIGNVDLQRPYVVLSPTGEVVCTYVADFTFWDRVEDRFRVIDVKGVETDVFKLKRKLVRAFLGIEIEVVKA